MKGVLDVLLLGFVPALLLGWHLDLRRARAERSSVLNKNAPVGPQSPSEQTLLGEGSAELDAKRQAKQIGLRGERPEKISVSRLPITGSDVFGREEDETPAVGAGRRQRKAEHFAQKAVRHLNEDARSVAGIRLAAAGAAVFEID